MNSYKIAILIILISIASCAVPTTKKPAALYEQHCASCHLAPSIEHLPKNIWATKIVPDMAARMGIKDSTFNPIEGLSFEEMEATIKTGIYPMRPTITIEEWTQLKAYILAMAPDSLAPINHSLVSRELFQFEAKSISLDSTPGSFITFLEYNTLNHHIIAGDMNGNLVSFNYLNQQTTNLGQFNSPVVAYAKKEKNTYVTTIGQLNPTELSSGRIFSVKNRSYNSPFRTASSACSYGC